MNSLIRVLGIEHKSFGKAASALFPPFGSQRGQRTTLDGIPQAPPTSVCLFLKQDPTS